VLQYVLLCHNISVGTPTFQYISFLHSVLRIPSQHNSFSLVFDPRTKSDHNYFSIIHQSNTHTHCLSLSEPQNQALLPITAKHSLTPSISVSDHPSLTCQSTLTAKPSKSAKWGAETCAKRKLTSPCQPSLLNDLPFEKPVSKFSYKMGCL